MDHNLAIGRLRMAVEERKSSIELLSRAHKLEQDCYALEELIQDAQRAFNSSYSGKWFYRFLLFFMQRRLERLGRVAEVLAAEVGTGE